MVLSLKCFSPVFRLLPKRLARHSLIVGAALATCLNGGMASALDFNYTFSGKDSGGNPATLTGLITGLADNSLDQKSGVVITANIPNFFSATLTTYISGSGFDVQGGLITGVDIYFSDNLYELYLGNQGNYYSSFSWDQSLYIQDVDNTSASSLVFTPLQPGTAVPGPLPLLGAATALGWSRRLRRRCNSST